jgi:hypothetical protein
MGIKKYIQVLASALLISTSSAYAEDLEALCAEVQISISQEASLSD